MYFTSNIKFLRKRRSRTQDDVASALNLKRSTLSGYENGIAQPGIEILISFSGYYNLSIDTLLKVDLTKLSESQLGELERGYDAYVKGSNSDIDLSIQLNKGINEFLTQDTFARFSFSDTIELLKKSVEV